MADVYSPHTWNYKERITHGRLNTIEEGIAAASEAAVEALESVDDALEAAETATAAAAEATAAAESANTAASAVYSDSSFLLLLNDDSTLSLTYDDGE